jgi:hypothetical protein
MRQKRSLVGAVLAVLVVLAIGVATALAAAPKKGAKFKGTLVDLLYNGTSSPIKIGKFRAPVSFKVSSTGTQVMAFTYSDGGCFGGGGFGNHNPYTFPGDAKRFGALTVSAAGAFSASGSKSTHKSSGGTGRNKFTSIVITTSSLAGRFATPKKATGSITFSQSDVYNGHKPTTCGPVTATFTAKTH